jgi:hypothetical protein
MSAGWVAGSVRGRLLLGRRLGREPALDLARAGSIGEGLALLAASPYGRAAELAADVAQAQRAIAATLLLHLRLLAGWLPPPGVGVVRALAGWFEVVNIEDRLAYLLGHEPEHPFELGSLSVSWPALSREQTPGDLRAALAASAWGDPGSEEPADVHVSLRAAWARRVLAQAPEAHDWVGGALALVAARGLARGAALRAAALTPLLGAAWERAQTVQALASSLPRDAAWALEGCEEPADLWRAEAAWWNRVEHDAEELARGSREGRGAVVGVVALLAADARRASLAVAAAARGEDVLVGAGDVPG